MAFNVELPPLLVGFGDSVLAADEDALSAKRFSKVPRSVRPASSSVNRPDIFNNDSMRPRRFSSPSMYFALQKCERSLVFAIRRRSTYPFGGFLFFSTWVNTHSVL